MGYIVGPAIAGILAATIGPGPTLAIDAVSFVLSAVGVVFVRRDLRAPVDRPGRASLTEIREGIDYIVTEPGPAQRDPVLGRDSILLAPLVTALTVHITRDLGDDAVGPRARPGGVRRRDRDRVAAQRAPDRPGPRRPGPPRRQPRPRPVAAGRAAFAVEIPVLLAVGRRGRRRPVHGPGHVHHAADGLLAGRAAGSHRQHGPDDLARTAADRAARRRRAHRRDQRLDDDRGAWASAVAR